MINESLFASSHQVRLDSEQDALDAIAIQGPGLIFRVEDVSPHFFDLGNGLAGSVFQKFINYNQRVVFVVPEDHDLGDRVTELSREHSRHSHIRILRSDAEALDWLRQF